MYIKCLEELGTQESMNETLPLPASSGEQKGSLPIIVLHYRQRGSPQASGWLSATLWS